MKKVHCPALTKKGKYCKNHYYIPLKHVEYLNTVCWIHSSLQMKIETENEQQQEEELKTANNNNNETKTNSIELVKITEKIYGIIIFYILHSKEYNQTIFLFGEYHDLSREIECQKRLDFSYRKKDIRSYIVDYIKAILQGFDHMFFDFYLEINLVIKEKKLQPITMESMGSKNIKAITNLFSGCLEEIKEKKCGYSNVRVHAADARFLDLKEKNTLYFDVMLSLENYLQDRILNVDEEEYQNMKLKFSIPEKKNEDLFHPIKKNKHGKYNMSEIEKFFNVDKKSYIVKEINKIDEKKFNHDTNIKKRLTKELDNIRTLVVDFYMNESEEVFDEVEQAFENGTPEFGEETVDFFSDLNTKLKHLYNKWLEITLQIMDLYTLARIFHEFKAQTDEQKQKNFPKYATNIMYYAGADHINYTFEILKEFGFNEIYNSRDVSYDKKKPACVKAPSFEILEKHLIPWIK